MRDDPRRDVPSPLPSPATAGEGRVSNWARRLANRASANRRKISPRTGVEYCPDVNPELARSWSAASHSRFSSVLVAESFSDGAIHCMATEEPPDQMGLADFKRFGGGLTSALLDVNFSLVKPT